LIDYIWIGFIAVTVITAVAWWWRGRKHVAQRPELAKGYRRLIRAFVLWANLPWVVMGLGLTVGGVKSVGAYLEPSEANPWVVACYLSIIVLWALSLWWVFRRGGAQQLVDHPGLLSFSPKKPEHVKLIAVGGVIVGLTAIVFLFFDGMLPYWTSRGDGYTTVFIVYDGFWRVVALALFMVAIGVVGLIFSIPWFRRAYVPRWWHDKEASKPAFLLILSVLWLSVTLFAFSLNIRHSYRLVSAYAGDEAQIVEGPVHVLRKQPEGGHAPGDLVEIDGVQLVVEYFRITPAYKKTIEHGGVLSEGTYARVWHYEGKVLRVDVRQ